MVYLSVGEFSINDFIVTVMFLLAFMFYVKSQYKFYAFFASLAVLTKETAVFLTLGLVIVELFQKKKRLLPLLIPSVTLFVWIGILTFTGHTLWNAYNFSATASRGSVYTIYFNLISLNFLNQFAYENWLHLFIFNFNWIYTIFAMLTFLFLRKKKQRKEIYAIGIVALVFCVLVLSFQTWTINRYTLPLLPFLYLFASYGALQAHFKYFSILLLIFIAFLSMAHSVDPVSDLVWPKTRIFNEAFYLKEKLDGRDGITYNLQYLTILKQSTTEILNNQCHMPRLISYDRQTLAMLNVKTCR
ncbi:MAG: hypothetical protein ACR2LN_07660 [Candidatus Levyibacteriota bacterium]